MKTKTGPLTDFELEMMLYKHDSNRHTGIYSLVNGAYWCRELNELGKRAAEEILNLRGALKKIVDEGDHTAPEGMKRIAKEALGNGPPSQRTNSCASFPEDK